MNKNFIFLLLIICPFISYAETFTINEYNLRAFDAINLEPASAIYYSKLSMDKNVHRDLPQEYVNSLYIQSLAYNILEDNYNSQLTLQNAYDYLRTNGFYFRNKEFYIDYFHYLIDLEEYNKVLEIISDKNLISLLEDRELIKFNIVKIELDIILESDSIIKSIDQSITASKSFKFDDLLSSLLLIKADYISKTNIKKANSIYKEVIEINETYYVIKALIRLGNSNNNSSYLEDAYLRSESLNDYLLTKKILESLISIYRDRNNYKKLYISYERLEYINSRYLTFLINESKKKSDYSYESFKLNLEIENKNSLLELFKLIVIALGVIIIVMTILLSIQSYKLRY